MGRIWRGGMAASFAFLAIGASAPDLAAQEAVPVSATQDIPAIIPTSAFASRSLLEGAQLSPDGRRFVFSMQQGGSSYLVVYDADTRQYLDGRNIGDEFDLNWFRWAGNDRLLFSLTSAIGKEERQHRRILLLPAFGGL